MKKLILTMTLIMIITTGCTNHSENTEHPIISGVQVETVSKKPVESFYTTSATVKSKTNSVVASILTGKVTSLAVQEGDSVKAGQLLLTIDSRDTAQKAIGASAGIKAAQMAASSAAQNAKMAARTYQRYKNLYDEKVITKQEIDQYTTQKNVAQLQYQQAQAGVQQARAGLGEVKVFQSYARVTAPVSGIVTQRNIDLGSTAIQGQPILTIEAPGEAELVANIDESYLDKVKENDVVFLEINGKTIKRKITKVVKHIDPTTRTFKVKIDITSLTGGQFAKINIPVSKKEAIAVPKSAVVQKGELTGVYTVDSENVISYRLIRTGKTFGDKVEVLSGLSDGDKIITVGVEKAIDGGKIDANNEENKVNLDQEKLGISGKIAGAFIQSKLTPLIIIASIILGLFAVVVTPREEEPQIVVPMADVFVQYPGASAQEVEARVTKPMEQLISEIPGVEYVYSIIRPGSNLTIVRYYVGQNAEASIVKLNTKLSANYDRIPQGVSQPLIKMRSIDDVPILALTLSSKSPYYSGYELRRIGAEVADELKKDKDVSEVSIIGGQKRQVRVTFDPAKLHGYNLSSYQIIQSLQKSNFMLNSGKASSGNQEFIVDTGGFLKDSNEIGNLVVGVNGAPIYLKNVADIEDSAQEPVNYVFNYDKQLGKNWTGGEAVTIALSKKKGTNATNTAHRALKKIENLKGNIIPSAVDVSITRNYGETAKEKSDELLSHMLIATISVILLIAFFLGRKEAIVVAVAVPVTLALTLLVSFLLGYTLNRVTLFALIFSIGILVDDAIVVVENIHRHFKIEGASIKAAVNAVNEVGNPTILATFTVVASLLPMAFVSGLMGPYMRPIPIGASAAMIFSLLVAFIVSPWLSYIVLKATKKEGEEDHQNEGFGGKMVEYYKKILTPLIEDRKKRMKSIKIVIGLLIVSMLLIPLKLVQFKMLPFDNKSELQVIVDMPEGTTLEQTAMVTQELGKYIQTIPEVVNYQTYIGTSAPYNFNGLVRHYFLRSGSNEADIQVNFKSKHERHKQSHELAKLMRPDLQKIGEKYNANVKLAEIPPGPPVISTLVAEVYGPNTEKQVEIASHIKDIFSKIKGVVDVDWYVEAPQNKITFAPDKEKAALNGVGTDAISQTLQTAIGGSSIGLVHFDKEKEPVDIFLRMPLSERADINSLASVSVPTQNPNNGGNLISLSELVKENKGIQDQTIYHKNMRRVTYVTGDVAKEIESPVYAVLDMQNIVSKLKLSDGSKLKQLNTAEADREDKYSVKWDGEWHITLVVFRDMGIAFAAVLVLIYVLVVAWFKDFKTPLVIMAPIPLTLVGILPGRLIFHAFFTATSMIGFIALSGIIVRNSILLVDFIQLEQKEGNNLKDSVIKAGLVRFRPILLTALAVVVGSFVMLFDPIFQGLAIAMMFGAVVATILTLVVVPVLYYEMFSQKEKGE